MDKERARGAVARCLLENDIAHVKKLLPLSLMVYDADWLLDSAYWRRRLHQILRQNHLSKSNLQSIDALIAILDRFEATPNLATLALKDAAMPTVWNAVLSAQ
jgi:hypothetical protein